jgi:hypothetical protein
MVKYRLGAGDSTAKALTDRFVAAGILRELTGQRRHRVFVADEVIELLEDLRPQGIIEAQSK